MSSSEQRADCFLLTPAQVHTLNAQLPTGFLLEQTHVSKASVPPPILNQPRRRRAVSTDFYPGLFNILTELKTHPKAGPFLVEPSKVIYPDYREKVKSHIDLSTLEEKLQSRGYNSAYEFSTDARKMWSSALQYYRSGSEEYISALTLSELFEKLVAGRDSESGGKQTPLKSTYARVEEIRAKSAPKPLSRKEKQLLAENIRKLEKQYLLRIVHIVSGHKPDKDQFEFDIETLSPQICRELNKYVKDCIRKQSLAAQKNPGASAVSKPDQNPPESKPPPQKLILDSDSSSSSSSSSSSDSEVDNGADSRGVPPGQNPTEIDSWERRENQTLRTN